MQYNMMIVFLLAAFDTQHKLIADTRLNTTEAFGADAVKEMPLMTGVGLSKPNPACRSTFGAIALTPKAFRLYVFKQSEAKTQTVIEAHSMPQAREISFGIDQCQAVLIITRSLRAETGKVDLEPDAGSGVPGDESRDVLDERNMFVTGAYFYSTNVDCGTSDLTFQFDQYGLMMLTSLGNSLATASKISNDHSFRSVIFSHGGCSTKVDVHFYQSIDGKPSQLDQR